MARKPIPIDKLDIEAIKVFMSAIKDEAALPSALIVGAMLENILMTLLCSFFREGAATDNLFKAYGGLESYSKCANMAYCLGFIPLPVLKNLERIGKVRNLFAHSTTIREFTDPEISAECDKLTFPNLEPLLQIDDPSTVAEIMGPEMASNFPKIAGAHITAGFSLFSARQKFVHVGRLTYFSLLFRANLMTRQEELEDVFTW